MTAPSSAPSPGEEHRLTVVEVAIMLGKRYHKARDLMLRGVLGKPEYSGRTLTVPAAGVRAWLAKRTEGDG